MEKLKELIHSRFDTDVSFGMAIRWTPQKVGRFMAGVYIPRISEAVTISRVLGITLDDLASFFAN